eukprot:338369-Chlamydomonas_euryale.AAC.3
MRVHKLESGPVKRAPRLHAEVVVLVLLPNALAHRVEDASVKDAVPNQHLLGVHVLVVRGPEYCVCIDRHAILLKPVVDVGAGLHLAAFAHEDEHAAAVFNVLAEHIELGRGEHLLGAAEDNHSSAAEVRRCQVVAAEDRLWPVHRAQSSVQLLKPLLVRVRLALAGAEQHPAAVSATSAVSVVHARSLEAVPADARWGRVPSMLGGRRIALRYPTTSHPRPQA